ncbi:MAG: hypothetical protein J5819_09215 [Eubacterium sp.]|nr:hypothetical protein [Eubacterium sp.]
MGIFSGIWEGIKSIGKAVVGFVGKVASKIGPVVGKIAKTLGTIVGKIAPVIEVAVTVFEIIHKIVHSLGKAHGVEADDDAAEIGMKVEQDDKSIDDFDGNASEYLKYLKHNVKVDPEKLKNLSPEEKVCYQAVGTSLETKALKEKSGIELTPECLAFFARIVNEKLKGNTEWVELFINKLSEAGINNSQDLMDYLLGKKPENSDQISEIFSALDQENNLPFTKNELIREATAYYDRINKPEND